MNDETQGIKNILHERERLDRILKEKFVKKRTIFFSDVAGYTQYMDTRGDINGRAWIQRHHDIVLPSIGEYGGEVLDIMGDGVMASFESTLSAVKSAVAVQTRLDEHNRNTPAADWIRVRIGIHAGEILTDTGHVAGDVVNVASRIQNQAEPGEILVSKHVYEEVCGSEDILCRFHKTVQLKGKPDPFELYRIVWRDEASRLEPGLKVRAPTESDRIVGEKPTSVFHLEVAREGNRLKLSAHEQTASDASTIRHYEEIQASMEWVAQRSQEMAELLNRANRSGKLSRELITKLRELGQRFSDELFTPRIKEKIAGTPADHFTLHVDDRLVHFPWELLHDGKQFLCQRFSMGRLVKTQQSFIPAKVRPLERPLRVLILADPKGDLKGAYQEGTLLRDLLDRDGDLFNVTLRSENLKPDWIKEKIRNFDLVHFAGHAEYDPNNPNERGWPLSSGILRPDDIMKMAGTAPMPAMVFSNGCQSARTEEWSIKDRFHEEIFGLANAFLLSGVKHYVGTFWEILDEPSRRFALEFYGSLIARKTIGTALRDARAEVIKAYGEETIVWASYVLYGDPVFNYMDQITDSRAEERGQKVVQRPKEIRTRTHEEVIEFGRKDHPKVKGRRWALIASFLVLVVAGGLFGYAKVSEREARQLRTEALAYYRNGDFDRALAACETIDKRGKGLGVSSLVRGNILLTQGKLDDAKRTYEAGIGSGETETAVKAEMLNGLGRIASIQKDYDAALGYYRKASDLAPNQSGPLLSQAIILGERGEYDDVLKLLETSQTLAPDDLSIKALLKETRETVRNLREKEQQDRIDRLVKELIESAPSGSTPAVFGDGWTSTPITLWLMDIHTQGYSFQEGEAQLLGGALSERLTAAHRMHLVERAILPALLEELKIGSSRLSDPATALSLGRLMAARLILAGRLTFSGPQGQVALRLIETESGTIKASLIESFGLSMPASALAKKLSSDLLEQIGKAYPLRGKVIEVDGNRVRLNIGQMVGVKEGDFFRLESSETTIKVVEAEQERSLGEVVRGDTIPEKGDRVEQVKQPST
jgi:class 3 adenylate cyclase/CHAT domain-containing protein/tetratricopeptide (TPR) repeat protein